MEYTKQKILAIMKMYKAENSVNFQRIYIIYLIMFIINGGMKNVRRRR